MKRTSAVSLALALLALAGCGDPIPPYRGGDGAPAVAAKWSDHVGKVPFAVSDFEGGLELARAKGKPPLFFLTATW